jgi:hypothetical protein
MKKLNNKILIIVLVALVAIYGLSRMFRASSRESNLPKELVALDTAAITEIKIFTAKEFNKEIRLVKEGKNWTVKSDNKSANVEQGSVNSSVGQFVHLKPIRLVTKKKTKWKEYSVGDSSTQVKFMNGSKVLADIRIGRVQFDMQPGQQQFNPNSISTYVRLSGEDEVYSVEGFLESTFNKSYNDWRDKAFLRLKQNVITKVTFTYPADSGFVIEKREKKWWVNDQEADSVKVKGYLAQLEYKNATTFADDFKSTGNAQAIIQFNAAAGNLATVQAWKRADDWAMNSTHQANVNFSSKGLESLLERKENFLPDVKKK